MQTPLAKATQGNAPNLRYTIILGELQREARRVIGPNSSNGNPSTSSLSGTHDSSNADILSPGTEQAPASLGSAEWDLGSMDFPLDPNLWMQLDSFPFSKSSDILMFRMKTTVADPSQQTAISKTITVSPLVQVLMDTCDSSRRYQI